MSYTNPDGKFKNLSRFGGQREDKPRISWSSWAKPEEIGAIVQALTAEGVRVAFNRTRDESSLIVTLTSAGDTVNVYLAERADFDRFLADLYP